MRKPQRLLSDSDVEFFASAARKFAPNGSIDLVMRRLEFGRAGGYDPARWYDYAEVWGGQNDEGFNDPEKPGLVTTLGINPERDMTSRWEPSSGLSSEQYQRLLAWVARVGGRDARVPDKVRVWRFPSWFDVARLPE